MKSDGLWRAVTAVVRSEISDDERNLLSGAEFSGIRSGVARIRLAENEKMINLELLAAKLSKAFSLISGRNIACKFATNGSARLARLPHPPRLNEFFTFENYIVGPANRLAHAAILSCGEKGTAGFNPVVITGGTGLGKTHLLQALCFRLFGKKRVFCFSAEDFTDAVSEAAAADSLDEMRREYSTVDVLLFDDLQMLSAADGSREEFFNFFNWLLAHGRPVVITSSEPPENLKKFEDRILSRLSWGISFALDTPSFEMRIGIAGSLARRYGLSISDEIIKYVAGRNEDGHKMEDFFRKMSVVASLAQRPIDLRFVKEMLGDGAREPRKPTIDEIQSAVADEFGLSRSEMNGKTRRKEVAWPRQVGMYLARELTDYSLEEIGGLFGGRDHATVVHACRRVGRTVAEDSTTRVRVATLRRRILEASILNGRSA